MCFEGRERLLVPHTLEEWLNHCYSDWKDKNKDLSREDIHGVGGLLRRMLKLEPEERALALEILQDP